MSARRWLDGPRSPAEFFAVDTRALAVLRIGLAGVVLVDLATRARDLSAHYSDSGVLPRSVLIANVPDLWPWSVHLLAGTSGVEALLFLVAGAVAVALLLGVHTRAATIGTWYLLASLQARNPLVLTGADTLLRLLLFWAMFLPLGARWSIDARRTTGVRAAGCIAAPATAALMLQVCTMYWASAANKSYEAWVVQGSAAYYALHVDPLVAPWGRSMLAHPGLLRAASRIVYWLECVGPALAFAPVSTVPIRLAVVALFGLMHLGFALSMRLGLFPVVSVLGWVAFVPGSFWHAVARGSAEERSSRPVLYGSTSAGLAAFALLGLVVWWNLASLPGARAAMPAPLRSVVRLLHLEQRWNLFAPVPRRSNGWFVVPGRLADGASIDLFAGGGPVRWTKPALVSATFENVHWRKYLVRLAARRYAVYRPAYGEYLCRTWRGRGLRRVRIYLMREWTPRTPGVVKAHRILLHRHTCAERGGAPTM